MVVKHWKKPSLIHYQNLWEKMERNLKEGKLGLGKRHFLRKRKQILFVWFAVHAFVFLYFISCISLILKIKMFRHFPNTLSTVNTITILNYFRSSDILFCTFFSYNNFERKMLFHVIKIQTKFTWSIINLFRRNFFYVGKEFLFSLTLMGEKLGRWIKTFWYSSPYSSPAMKVWQLTFDSFYNIYLRRLRWRMELIAAVWTKLKNFLSESGQRTKDKGHAHYVLCEAFTIKSELSFF